MTSTKQLFCCGLLVLSLAGCGSLPRETPGETPPGSVPPPSGPPSADAAEALFHALSTLDIDYRHGGQTRASGFDCSGLVRYVFSTAYGITLPRLAHEQGRAGLAVSRARLEPGSCGISRSPYRFADQRRQ